MASRSKQAMFGTPFEELDESEAASKKPLRIEDQIVTDEKGRRRFHGAFTGGFSAGYFNTVGTKEGWSPATFKSTRSKREEQQARKPEDFMDKEDVGEYGIAPRRIQTTKAFTEDASRDEGAQKRKIAGETSNEVQAIADRLSDLIRPVSDSVGVKLMRSMGWRPGKGVGASQLALIRERAKAAAKTYGCELPPGAGDENVEELAIAELETMAPGFQFSPNDVEFIKFEPKANLHGLGYKGLDVERHLKSAKILERGSTLKVGARQTKGIRGQAFGVGAFEDDDEDLFAVEDLSSYDYTLGASAVQDKPGVSSDEFVFASKVQPPRQFFPPPKLPRDYTPSVASTSKQPKSESTVPKFEDRSKNAVQRASALGEGHSVWSLVSERDRQRIEDIKSSGVGRKEIKQEPAEIKKEEKPKELDISKLFPNDPKKRGRLQDFVNYLKRGLYPPQPPDLTEWEWEKEQIEFRKLLPSELVAAEDDARSRLKPLAGPKIAAVFSSGLKSKFTKSSVTEEEMDEAGRQVHEDEDKVKAVQLKMFGAMTREKHEWHPDRNLCKRFNVPNPYPESRVVGVPYFKKDTKAGLLPLDFDIITRATGDDGAGTSRDVVKSEMSTAAPIHQQDESEEPSTSKPRSNNDLDEEPQRPPMSLFKAVFAQSSSSSSDTEEEIESQAVKPSTSQESIPPKSVPTAEPTVSVIRQQFGQFLDTLSSANEKVVEMPVESGEIRIERPEARRQEEDMASYGPTLPPDTSDMSLPPTSVIKRHKHKKKKSHKRKKSKDEIKSHKKHRKHKERKKSRRIIDTVTLSSESESEDSE